MYNERIVKKPRKVYRCESCGCEITGEHIYTAQAWEGDFHTRREHKECSEYMHNKICVHCDECGGLSEECFIEGECRDCPRYYNDDEECNITIYECIKIKLKEKKQEEQNERDQ